MSPLSSVSRSSISLIIVLIRESRSSIVKILWVGLIFELRTPRVAVRNATLGVSEKCGEQEECANYANALQEIIRDALRTRKVWSWTSEHRATYTRERLIDGLFTRCQSIVK